MVVNFTILRVGKTFYEFLTVHFGLTASLIQAIDSISVPLTHLFCTSTLCIILCALLAQSLYLPFVRFHSLQSTVSSQKLLLFVSLSARSSTIVFRLKSLPGIHPIASRHIYLLVFLFCP